MLLFAGYPVSRAFPTVSLFTLLALGSLSARVLPQFCRGNPERQSRIEPAGASHPGLQRRCPGYVSLFFRLRLSLVTESCFFQIPPKGRRGFEKGKMEWCRLVHATWVLGFDPGAQLPDEGAQLACDCDLDLVVMHSAPGQCHEAGVEPQLGVP